MVSMMFATSSNKQSLSDISFFGEVFTFLAFIIRNGQTNEINIIYISSKKLQPVLKIQGLLVTIIIMIIITIMIIIIISIINISIFIEQLQGRCCCRPNALKVVEPVV